MALVSSYTKEGWICARREALGSFRAAFVLFGVAATCLATDILTGMVSVAIAALLTAIAIMMFCAGLRFRVISRKIEQLYLTNSVALRVDSTGFWILPITPTIPIQWTGIASIEFEEDKAGRELVIVQKGGKHDRRKLFVVDSIIRIGDGSFGESLEDIASEIKLHWPERSNTI